MANQPLEKSTDNINEKEWQRYLFKKVRAGTKKFDTNLEHATNVDKNMKLDVLEVRSQKQIDIKYLRVRQDL